MNRRWRIGLVLSLLMVLMLQMTAMAAGETVTINNCVIQGNDVVVIASGTATAPDGNYYLFALQPYETSVGARVDYCAMQPAAPTVQFNVPLGLDTIDSKLYSRFVVTTLQNGAYVPVSTESYITNPEAVAKRGTTSIAGGIKKGLAVGLQDADQLTATGSKHTIVGFSVSRLLTGSGYNYTYNGKTYSFNPQIVAEFDIYVQAYNAQAVDIAMAILSERSEQHLELLYPAARVTNKNPRKYALNVTEQIPMEEIAAAVSFLADRYSGTEYGTVTDFIIGNEVNSSDSWHYAGELSASDFGVEYAKQFRVCYNAIKSNNSTANVFICTDQRWTHNDGGSSYGGKPVIEAFNSEIRRTGNINWGLSFHPYGAPLENTSFWTPANSSYAKLKLEDHTDNTKMVTPMNIDVVTNKFSQPEFLAPSGAVRDIIVSEFGFSSIDFSKAQVEDVQSAAIAYACKTLEQCPYIKFYIYNSARDNAVEINQGLAVGILRPDGSTKPAYNTFAIVDTGNTDYVLPTIGVSSWAQLGLK